MIEVKFSYHRKKNLVARNFQLLDQKTAHLNIHYDGSSKQNTIQGANNLIFSQKVQINNLLTKRYPIK